MVAVTAAQAFATGIAVGLLVVAAVVAFTLGRRRTQAKGGIDIPPGMAPGPSDADLEKPLLEKLYVWGLLLVLTMAVWLPVVWLREPDSNSDDLRDFQSISVERGRLTTLPGSEENPLGFGCTRCHGDGLRGGRNLFNGGIVAVPDLVTVCGGEKHGHPLIKSLDDVVTVIAAGRPGTDMPSWSVRYSGAMHDEQIQDVVNYILSIQEVPEAENICVNPPETTT